MKPLSWDRYSEFLRRLHDGPARCGPVKRIALIGLPLIDRGPHPLKAALAASLDRYPHWQISFMSEAHLESFELLARIPCDGILGRVVSEEMAVMARKLACPLVNISSLVENPGVQTVRRDDRQLGHLCARNLLEKGFSRISVIEFVPATGWCFGETRAGFVEFVQQHASRAILDTLQMELALSEPEMIARLRCWLRALHTPCALFLTDDRFAIAVMEACREESLHVPKDVAIISSVLTPEMAVACGVTLTHPAQDAEWLIGPACERLESLMRNPRQPLSTMVIPCPGMAQGESTQTFTIGDPLVKLAVDFVDSHFQEGINVADIIFHVECSRRALERRFVNQLNITMHDYLIQKRVACAKKIINATPEQKFDIIARACSSAPPIGPSSTPRPALPPMSQRRHPEVPEKPKVVGEEWSRRKIARSRRRISLPHHGLPL